MLTQFKTHEIAVNGTTVFAKTAGSGRPILLLHGYPQTHAMWHRVAPVLAEQFSVVLADLRGYGRSGKPPTDVEHLPYSKREMAKDLIALMDHLGHSKFAVGAHDRGARVAHRLALDHSDRVTRLALLDIAPTREMYRDSSQLFASSYWHWYFLIQPAPFPERLIEADPEYYWKHKCGSGSAGLDIFTEEALEDYLNAFRRPETIHASCEDYRAAASIDLIHDAEDGVRRLQQPLLALWGLNGVIEKCFDPLALWRERADTVHGRGLPGGHYLAEEVPQLVLEEWLPFFGEAV